MTSHLQILKEPPLRIPFPCRQHVCRVQGQWFGQTDGQTDGGGALLCLPQKRWAPAANALVPSHPAQDLTLMFPPLSLECSSSPAQLLPRPAWLTTRPPPPGSPPVFPSRISDD